MTDLVIAFFLGPLIFIPRLINIGTSSSIDLTIFIASGLGTAFWARVVTVLGGFTQG